MSVLLLGLVVVDGGARKVGMGSVASVLLLLLFLLMVLVPLSNMSASTNNCVGVKVGVASKEGEQC